MNKRENGFAVIIALLIVAAISAVAAASFFVSVADLKITFNRRASAHSLRDAERVLAEAEISMERCLRGNGIGKCVSEIPDEVAGANAETSGINKTFTLTALGSAGNFSTEIEAFYSEQNGKITMNSWRRKPR